MCILGSVELDHSLSSMICLSTENKQNENVAEQLQSTSVQYMTEKSNRPTKVEMNEGILIL